MNLVSSYKIKLLPPLGLTIERSRLTYGALELAAHLDDKGHNLFVLFREDLIKKSHIKRLLHFRKLYDGLPSTAAV